MSGAREGRGGARPGAGRPADAGERRTHVLQVRVSDGELAELEAAIADANTAGGAETTSSWLRDAGLARARRPGSTW